MSGEGQKAANAEQEKNQGQDNDDATTYSGASTSRLASTPVEKGTTDNSNESSDKESKDPQKPLEQAAQSDVFERSTIRKVFQGIIRRRETGSNRRSQPEAAVSGELPRKDSVVYVEKGGKFRPMKKNVFEKQQEIGVKKVHDNIFSSVIGFISSKHPDVAVAYSFQNSFHNISMIMQGFLSGLTVAEAVFAFSFASEELLLNGYRWLTLPVHVVFLICFTVGGISAIDRTAFYGWKMSDLKKTLSHGGIIGIVLWMIGLVASSACIRFDEAIAPSAEEVILTPELLTYWRVCSAVRAVCASSGWLLLALRPDSNVLGDIIKKTAVDEMLQRNVNLLEEAPPEFRGQLAEVLNVSH